MSLSELDSLLAELAVDSGSPAASFSSPAPAPAPRTSTIATRPDPRPISTGASQASSISLTATGAPRSSMATGRVSTGVSTGIPRGMATGAPRGMMTGRPAGMATGRPGMATGRPGMATGRPGMATGISVGGNRMMTGAPGRRGKGAMSSGPGAAWLATRGKNQGPAFQPKMPTHDAQGRELTHSGPPCDVCTKQIFYTIKNVDGKKMHPECFTCAHCHKPLTKFIRHDTDYYCPDDWFELFSPKCHNCKQPVKSKRITVGARVFHPEHFLCMGCGTSLVGKKYKTDLEDDVFCGSCIKAQTQRKIAGETCFKCKLPIIGTYAMYKGQPYHPEHFTCSTCNKRLQASELCEYEGRWYCRPDYLKQFRTVCEACKKPIVAGGGIQALGRDWHKRHFVCAHCHMVLPSTNFWAHEGTPYCEDHYKLLFGKTCVKCQKAVIRGGIVANGKHWHEEHFNCTGCDRPLKGTTVFMWEDKPYDRRCFNKLPKKVRVMIERQRAGELAAQKRKAKEAKAKAKGK